MKHWLALALALSLGSVSAHAGPQGLQIAQAESSDVVEAQVQKIDKDAQKLTIRHGPLPNLDMPAMAMVYRVNDPKLLDQVKVGDKIKVRVARVNGAFTVLGIEP
jgi:Cu(I)/Ag(I) efflux system protein CusF